MEMGSKAMGHLSMAGDTFTAEYVEFEVKRALEWLGADRNEGRRHAAVSAPSEIAVQLECLLLKYELLIRSEWMLTQLVPWCWLWLFEIANISEFLYADLKNYTKELSH